MILYGLYNMVSFKPMWNIPEFDVGQKRYIFVRIIKILILSKKYEII